MKSFFCCVIIALTEVAGEGINFAPPEAAFQSASNGVDTLEGQAGAYKNTSDYRNFSDRRRNSYDHKSSSEYDEMLPVDIEDDGAKSVQSFMDGDHYGNTAVTDTAVTDTAATDTGPEGTSSTENMVETIMVTTVITGITTIMATTKAGIATRVAMGA
ncbi:hypothetical protein GNI_022120 [Gregarina niphandrodes]|uniref:Transmembrane protein n=1 Tax=Gregarina niphandrodes TaxID=110365 RepID=A0A023BBP6_GRENI|nr:hypothetical protein GNI_022120 [Gregarina niphandrodes]EZG80243.1 hypothetical protein GNI_022120 [Gregarina niphandrodes]|eukprot:XP_011134314.1 hypothetical protein GNI_022120 [Gregarina niphandrodes]